MPKRLPRAHSNSEALDAPLVEVFWGCAGSAYHHLYFGQLDFLSGYSGNAGSFY